MRTLAAGATVFAVLCAAACAPGADGDLRALVERSSLPGVEKSACEWGSSGFDSDPKAWYGCWGESPWPLKKTSTVVKRRLVAQGFDVSAERGPRRMYFTAVRGQHTLCVDVLAPGYATARNTYPAQVAIAAGHAFVDVWAVNPRASQNPCPFLPDGAEE